ncbi:site-specific integrase [Empedobacter sedimenti]|uniref:site-specific integrase n=1 Tax=Empedobacter sedimenti TaxID=3042610 RepID=UPI0024A69DCD|nr:site-specific integrase [Empedobacter sedimenti]
MNVTFVLAKPSSNLETTIEMVVRWDSQQIRISSKKKILPKNWNPLKMKVKDSNFNKTGLEINSHLEKMKSSATDVYIFLTNGFGRPPLKEEFKVKFKNYFFGGGKIDSKPKITTLVEAFNLYIKTKTYLKESSIQTINQTKTNIVNYELLNKEIVTLDNFDVNIRNSLIDLFFELDYKGPTIYRRLKYIRTVLKFAEELGYSVHPYYKVNSFLTKDEESYQIALTEEELNEFINLDLNYDSSLELVRDQFLALVITGQRFSDLNKITSNYVDDDGSLKFIQEKTKISVHFPLMKNLKQILDKYPLGWPIRYSNQKFNKKLQAIAKKCSLLERPLINNENIKRMDKISSHTARRSFVTIYYSKGVPLDVIMLATGHKQEKTVKGYIKMNKNQEARLLEMVLKDVEINISNE